MRKYQYHVYNEHLNLIITISKESNEHAESLARLSAMSIYDCTEEQLEGLSVEFLCSFQVDSVVNLKLLNG